MTDLGERTGIPRNMLYDQLGRWMIAVGGIGVIAAIFGIFLFIAKQTVPLFIPARAVTQGRFHLSGSDQVLAVGQDPYRQVGYAVLARGIDYFSLPSGRMLGVEDGKAALGAARITAAYVTPRGDRLALGLDDGRLLTGQVQFATSYGNGTRAVHAQVRLDAPSRVMSAGERVVKAALRGADDGSMTLAVITSSGRLLVVTRQRKRGLFSTGRRVEHVWDLTADLPQNPTAVTVGAAGKDVLAGGAKGDLVVWSVHGAQVRPKLVQVLSAAPVGTPVTALEFLLGDVSVIVGDSQGNVSTWFKVRETPGAPRRYRPIHHLRPHGAAVIRIAPSARDRQFVTADERGEVAARHATSEQTFWIQRWSGGPVQALAFAPKANGLLGVTAAGEVIDEALHNPHPEITLGTLFGKVWYEGYDAPQYVWQSTGGTDEFEPKLSLIPLIFGTIKGTLYAMLLALPLAVLAAIYTAEFASPQVRNVVKPVVEIMASLPSVILGFLAGLWLAPLLERNMLGLAATLPLVPLFVVLCAWLWYALPQGFRGAVPRYAELGIILAVTLIGLVVALQTGPLVERAFFGGSFKAWLTAGAHMRYDQRNCLVIGFAMGFAVIPLIFTICEDSLSSVPQSLRAGSLALGANRWQTALRVVLPMGAPGVFSAAMMGLGRAVGETMIVLMATGNTPIMDWSVFTGMRTIAANIAVELPEAPEYGTLYRVLFLSGLLLFVLTFVVNTVAEGVRQRLRRKYKRL